MLDRLSFQWCFISLVAFVGTSVGGGTPAKADDVFAVYGDRGTVTYTVRKPPPGARFRLLTPRKPLRSRLVNHGGWSMHPRPSPYDKLILRKAREHRLEPALVKAVVHVESSFNAYARSPKGAMGLMQLMPKTARRFNVRDAYRPEENVDGGVRYLRMLYKRYRGNLQLALAAYNAGEGAVDRYGGIPPYSETRQYVKRVLRARKSYSCDYTGTRNCPS